ncbi:MAG: serine hydrolase [Anaerolineae bacterium]
MKPRTILLLVLALALIIGGVIGWTKYQQVRADYDAYRTLIQQGVKIAGLDVGWRTPEEARGKVFEGAAKPYYEDFRLTYRDTELTLSPGDDLGFEIPVDEMVEEAVAASHQYDYWQGFRLWIQGQAESLDLDVPLRMTFDESAATSHLEEIAKAHDIEAVEPMVDVQKLTFIPGLPGRRMDVAASAELINERVPDPAEREVDLPISITKPDQSLARIESMISTLGPVMERAPILPSYYTATIPLSTTGGLESTPLVDYTGELTWTFPHFISYTGHLTQTTGFFFDPGEPGYTFNVTEATRLVDLRLRSGMTEPITFEPDLVPPPPITPSLLLPPLEARLAEFPGVTSILVKNLDTGEMIYESNVDYVLSGMSIVKIGIMVEVYRHFGGEVDAQTHQELVDMLGSESCNPCANRLLATVGGGSASAGAQKVTNTMRRLGLANFYLCAPFRVVELWDDRAETVWTAAAGDLVFSQEQEQTPRYDRCVRATPREMADLVEMIYSCTQDEGLLRDAYPNVFSPETCEEMIDIMAANDLRNMLGAGIPYWIKLAHKHGFSGYDVPWGDTRGEVGIVFSPSAPWLISFYIWEDTAWINWGINQPLYRDVSNMLYNYFEWAEPFWPLPPWAPPLEEEAEEEGA